MTDRHGIPLADERPSDITKKWSPTSRRLALSIVIVVLKRTQVGQATIALLDQAIAIAERLAAQFDDPDGDPEDRCSAEKYEYLTEDHCS